MLRQDRQYIIEEIINIGTNEVGTSGIAMSKVILAITPEIFCWEITGIDVITPKLIEIENTPGHILAPMLSSIINVEGETMSQAISRMVNRDLDVG